MKLKTAIIALATVSSVYSTELVVNGNMDLEAINLWLRAADDPGAKPKLPDNHVEADDNNTYHWKDLKPGKYVICLDPDEENWAAHCIAAIPVEIGDALKTVNIIVPSVSVKLTVSFVGVDKPKQHESEGLVFRVERIDEGDTTNPYIRQWLWTEMKDGKLVGSLDYLEAGNYRIIAFSVDEQFNQKDIGTGLVTIDDATIKDGSCNVAIDKKVEQVAP